MTITLDQLNDSNMEKNSTSAAGLEEDENGEGIGNTNSDTADLKDVYGYGKPQMMALQKANKLADLIMQEPHRFALHGDPQLASNGLEALKALFDFSLETENLAIPPIAATLHSTFPDDEVADESIKAGSKRKRKDTRKNVNAHHLFEPTPLTELSVEGMSAGQVWDQMELRNAKISTLLDAIIVTDQAEDEDADQEDEDDEIDEEEGWGQTADSIGKDELVSKKGNKRAKLGQGEEDEEEIVNNLDKLTDAELRSIGIDPAQRKDFEAAIKEGQLDDSEDEEDSEDDDEHGYPGASDLSDDDELSGVILTEPLLSEAEQQKRKAEIEAREQRQMRSQRQFAKMMKRMQGGSEEDDSEEEEEEEEEEEDGQDEQDEDYNESEEEEEEDDEEEEERRKESILDNLDEKVQFSTATSGKKVKRNAELDDDFFSIEQFNKETDDYGDEGTDLGEDIDLFKSVDQPEDNDDEDEAGQIYYKDFFGPPPFKEESKPSFDESPIKPIEPTEKAPRRIPSVRFNDEVSVLRIKARKEKETQITPELLQMLQQYPDPDSAKAGIESDEETESDEDEEDYDSEDEEEDGDVEEDDMEQDGESEDERDADEEDEVDDDIMEADSNLGEQTNLDQTEKDLELLGTSDSDAEQETAERVAGDLFADEEENSEDDATSGISTHQRRLNALQEEISRLERENVGKKDWTLMGEAGSRARPENSLLEEDVEFESNRKSKPVNTPETTKTIEDLIKNRILENQFDDVQRRATLQPLDFMPSKMLELSDQKSSRSLDQVYEDDFGGVGDSQGQKLDKELQKEHDEIDQLYESLESQLDALSNAHFTPKAPKVSIQTINNAPTISMEESLPTTMSNGTQLAPEEVYAAGSHNEALEGASTELTPEEKRRRHRQLRDEKRAKNERIAEHKRNVEINREAFGQNRGGRFAGKSGSGKQNGKKASEEKEEALRKLMGNKGVSVVGKGDSDSAKKSRTHQSNGHTAPNASNYKL